MNIETCCLVIALKDHDNIIYCTFKDTKDKLIELGNIINENNYEEALGKYKLCKSTLYTECEGDKLSTIRFEGKKCINLYVKNYREDNLYIEVDNLYREGLKSIEQYKVLPGTNDCFEMNLKDKIQMDKLNRMFSNKRY